MKLRILATVALCCLISACETLKQAEEGAPLAKIEPTEWIGTYAHIDEENLVGRRYEELSLSLEEVWDYDENNLYKLSHHILHASIYVYENENFLETKSVAIVVKDGSATCTQEFCIQGNGYLIWRTFSADPQNGARSWEVERFEVYKTPRGFSGERQYFHPMAVEPYFRRELNFRPR